VAKEHGKSKSGGSKSKSHSGFTKDPGSGVASSKQKAPKKGKAKMTAAEWSKLPPKMKDSDYGGSRFESSRRTGRDKERGFGSK
jgi:hypothetical protein